MTYRVCAPCMFGVEGIMNKELRQHGFENISAETGRVFFDADEAVIFRANMALRTAERVLILVGRFRAETFTELFDQCLELSWPDFLPKNAAFPVKGYCMRSKLMSVPDCQAIIKKSISKKMGEHYKMDWLEESGTKYQIQFSFQNDEVCIFIDTSGAGLHKRGYRETAALAPIRETLAAAMVYCSDFFGDNILSDPFCGSGTIVIEAAMIAKRQSPGIRRKFACDTFEMMQSGLKAKVKEELIAREVSPLCRLYGSDIETQWVELAAENAKKAGVGDIIEFSNKNACAKGYEDGSIVVCNPPYGERLSSNAEVLELYKAFGKNFNKKAASLSIITPHEDFEKHFGLWSDKKRKLYNGMIKCELFMYNRKRVRVEAKTV